MISPIEWADDRVRLLDQTRLPAAVIWLECTRPEEIAHAIRTMQIRGAPALGIAAGFALALAAVASPDRSAAELLRTLEAAAGDIRATRPTARNLFWALERMLARAQQAGGDPASIRRDVVAEARAIQQEDIQTCRDIGRHGAALVPDPATILTHCNAGALATGGYGTALGVIRAAAEAGKRVQVLVDETRPLLQGARLTAWELAQERILATLITDSMAGYCLQQGKVDIVVVGADRIARNGDAANKIGTYPLAVLAREHGVPFYVAAPLSTADLSLASGAEMPIEERGPEEVRTVLGTPISPPEMPVLNPAFDVTPARLITAIICEAGVLRPPYETAWPER